MIGDEEVISQYLPLIHWNLKRYRHVNEYDDLLQEAILGILEAVQENNDGALDSSIKRAIDRHIKKIERNQIRHQKNTVAITGESGEDNLIEEIFAGSDESAVTIQHLWVQWLLEHLPLRQRQCVQMYYEEELSQSEIALRLGIRQQSVSHFIRLGMQKLRQIALAEN